MGTSLCIECLRKKKNPKQPHSLSSIFYLPLSVVSLFINCYLDKKHQTLNPNLISANSRSHFSLSLSFSSCDSDPFLNCSSNFGLNWIRFDSTRFVLLWIFFLLFLFFLNVFRSNSIFHFSLHLFVTLHQVFL